MRIIKIINAILIAIVSIQFWPVNPNEFPMFSIMVELAILFFVGYAIYEISIGIVELIEAKEASHDDKQD